MPLELEFYHGNEKERAMVIRVYVIELWFSMKHQWSTVNMRRKHTKEQITETMSSS